MQSTQNINYQKQIEEASRKAKPKKVLYIYDELGYKRLIGIFDKKKAAQVKKQLRQKKLLNRVSEIEIRTDLPNDNFE